MLGGLPATKSRVLSSRAANSSTSVQPNSRQLRCCPVLVHLGERAHQFRARFGALCVVRGWRRKIRVAHTSRDSGSGRSMEWKRGYLDALLVPVGLLFLLGYHIFFTLMVRKHPLRTVVGINHFARAAWVHSIMKDNQRRNILAVQTLRNSIMASTLMASTAILLSSGMAAFLSSTYSIKTPIQSIVLGANDQVSVSVKFLALLACFLFSFICYMQSIRFMNHVGYLINISFDGPGDSLNITSRYVAKVLARGSNFYTIGTRGFYFAFPLLLWVFGPIPVVVCCFTLVPLLYYLDMVTDEVFTPKVAAEP